jgi:hypothetical protein
MSDNWIILIPTRPDHVPAPHAQEEARALLAELLPQAEVTASVSPEIEFVHPFGNWSGVRCPLCHADLEDWCIEAITMASETAFANLTVITPCCGGTTNLNDLDYIWPAGFSRFCLEAHHPNVEDLDVQTVKRLESILDCQLRRIWQHV